MLIDIVILPPPSVAAKVLRHIERASQGRQVVYMVGRRGLTHHCSLFHINIARWRLPELMDAVHVLVKDIPKTVLRAKRYAGDSDGIWLDFNRPPALTSFKDKVVTTLAPLRQAPMPYSSSQPPTALKRRYRKRFGVHYNIGRFFQPHFTLAKFRNQADKRVALRRLTNLSIHFRVSTLAVAEVNRYGQVTRILKRFRV